MGTVKYHRYFCRAPISLTLKVSLLQGNRVGITVEDLYLPSSQYLRVLSADGSVLAEIRGQELPEERTHMVRNGLPMATVQLVGADGGEKTPSMFRLRVTCVCVDDSICGAHGSCVCATFGSLTM